MLNALGSVESLVLILNRASWYYVAGVAVAIGFKMGLFNIGADGQYRLAALFAGYLGAKADLPAVAQVLPYVDYFMPSIEEAEALTGFAGLADNARYFLDRGVKACVFTRGADGAYYHDAEGTRFEVPAFDIKVKCTCGCGDAFNAGFAVAYCHGFDPETTVRFAQATSALNATGLGSQAGVRSFEHTLDFLGELFFWQAFLPDIVFNVFRDGDYD